MYEECWQQSVYGRNYCALHGKLTQDKVRRLYSRIYHKVGDKKWNAFLDQLTQQAEKEDYDNGKILIEF